MKKESYRKIQKLIGEDKTEEALTLLEKHYHFFDNSLYKEVLLIKSRYQRLKKEKYIGSISNDDFSRQLNQINDSVLGSIKPNSNSILTFTDNTGNLKEKIKRSLSLTLFLIVTLILTTSFIVGKYSDIKSSISDLEKELKDDGQFIPLEGDSYEETMYKILDSYSCTDLKSASRMLDYKIYKKCK